jgi:hypothetical protein
MKAIGGRIRKLEHRLCAGGAKPIIWVVTNAAVNLALDDERCVEILDACGFLPSGPFGVVHLGGIPDGLNAEELEDYLRTNAAQASGFSSDQQRSRASGVGDNSWSNQAQMASEAPDGRTRRKTRA